MFNRKLTATVAAAVAAMSIGITAVYTNSATATAKEKSRKATPTEVDRLRAQILEFTKNDEEIQRNLKTFDTLDYDVFSNQKWDRLKESHAPNVKVVWPDGHFTTGIDVHISDLKNLFVFAPDTRIKEHPIAFGKGNLTIAEGIMEGTFTKPMPDGKGGFIQPTGKAFKLPMATIGMWKDGTMYEEHLFWDNQTYFKQLGL
jgi:SnoaL-like polyketide cyclase